MFFSPPHKYRHDPFTAGKWSADLISGVRPSALCSSCCLLCSLLQSAKALVRADSEGRRAERPEVSLPSRPGLSVPTALSAPSLQVLCLLLCSSDSRFCISEAAETSTRSTWKIKGVGDLLRVSRWHGHECTLHTHSHTFNCFLWPQTACVCCQKTD